jgi:hypothetical protein
MANMSPIAIATVVDVVGAERPKALSSDSCIGAGSNILFCRLARRGHNSESGWAVKAITVTPGGRCSATVTSSAVLPENVTNRTTSPFLLSGYYFWRKLDVSY